MHHHAGLLAAVPLQSSFCVKMSWNLLKCLETKIDPVSSLFCSDDMVRYGAILRPLLQDQSALAAEELQGQDAHALRGMSLASSHFIKTFPKQKLFSSHLFTRTCERVLCLSLFLSSSTLFTNPTFGSVLHERKRPMPGVITSQGEKTKTNDSMITQLITRLWMTYGKTTWRMKELTRGRKDCHARAFRKSFTVFWSTSLFPNPNLWNLCG